MGSDPKGRVHSVVATPASVHDAKAIYRDKTYADERRRQRAEEEGVQWRVHRKANRGRRLNCADRSYYRKNDRARARVEHS